MLRSIGRHDAGPGTDIGSSLRSSQRAVGWEGRAEWVQFTISTLKYWSLQLLQPRQISQDCQQRLPDVVRRLEEGIFKEAASKEEYMDLNTLPQRLQYLGKRVASTSCNQNSAQYVPPPVGTMTLTLGLSNATYMSSMMPTPGGDISMITMPSNPIGLGNMLSSGNGTGLVNENSFLATDNNSSKMMPACGFSSDKFSNPSDIMSSLPRLLNNKFQTQQGRKGISMDIGNQKTSAMGMPLVGRQMIPSVLNNSKYIATNAMPSDGLLYSNSMTVAHRQQQCLGEAQNSHMSHSMNGQLGGTFSTNVQLNNSLYGFANGSMNTGVHVGGNDQILMSDTVAFSNTGGLSTALQYINLQMSSQPCANQQCKHPTEAMFNKLTPSTVQDYAMNAPDLAGNGNFSNPATSSGLAAASSLHVDSSALPSTKTIHTSDLHSQQHILQSQQHFQQSQPQDIDSPQADSPVLPRSQWLQSQQWQQHQFQQQPPPPQLSHNCHSQHLQPEEHEHGHEHQHLEAHQLRQLEQRQQQQMQLFSKRTGAQLAQRISNPFRQKQETILIEDHDEPLCQKFSQQHDFSQPQSQQQQLLVKASQIQQSQGLQVQQNSFNSQQMHNQQADAWQQKTHSQNGANVLPAELPQDTCLQGHQESQAKIQRQQQQQPQQQVSEQQILGQVADEQHQQLPQASVDAMVPTVTTESQVKTAAGGTVESVQPITVEATRQEQYIKQQRWLLFLRHASKCTAVEGQCQATCCSTGKQLWAHIIKCNNHECSFSRCQASRTLLSHHRNCRDLQCPVCVPVRRIIMQKCAMVHTQSSKFGVKDSSSDPLTCSNAINASETKVRLPSRSETNVHEQSQHPPLKKAKTEPGSPSCACEQVQTAQTCIPSPGKIQVLHQAQPQIHQHCKQSPGVVKSEAPHSVKADSASMKNEAAGSSQQDVSQNFDEAKKDTVAERGQMLQEPSLHEIKSEPATISLINIPKQIKQEQETVPVELESGKMVPNNSASKKQKIKGVSLTEVFTPEQIREHITGLRQWIGQIFCKSAIQRCCGDLFKAFYSTGSLKLKQFPILEYEMA
eukprot:Gb_41266 [translate_table: standard]